MRLSVRLSRAVALGLNLLLVACNMATSPEIEPAVAAGASPASGGSGGSSGVGAPSSAGDGGVGGVNTNSGGAAGAGAGSNMAGMTAQGGAGAGGMDPGAEVPARDPNLLVVADFTQAELGTYTREDVLADFGSEATWDNGLTEERAAVEEEEGNRFLRVTFPNATYGPTGGGVQFDVDLHGSFEELFFAYRVRFQSGFAFNMGGKLPGLVGGNKPTGCDPDEGGFSARNMWRNGGGDIVQYVYWPDQPNTCGDDRYYDHSFTPGTWQTIEHRIVMNTPGEYDGVLQGWVDGELYLDEQSRQWRKTDAFAIDALYFSTFFGGGSQSWASPKEQWVDFDDLIVSKVPVSH
jgi:hypothetical protein